jgi:hypothetical protein
MDQYIHSLRGDRIDLLCHVASKVLSEVPDEKRNIFSPFPERRNVDGKYVQPIEQIGAESLIFHHSHQIAVRGCDEACVCPQRARVP